MSQDAIEYITPAAHLLPLVPRTWLQSLMRTHWEAYRQWNKGTWYTDIDQSSGANGMMSFSCNGEVGFHRDEGFDKFSYLLLLRPGDYNVTGYKKWRGLNPQQQAGDLICFHQQRRLHALVRTGTARVDADHLEPIYHSTCADHPGRLWCAITVASPTLLTPDEAVSMYETRLKSLPQNKFRKSDADR